MDRVVNMILMGIFGVMGLLFGAMVGIVILSAKGQERGPSDPATRSFVKNSAAAGGVIGVLLGVVVARNADLRERERDAANQRKAEENRLAEQRSLALRLRRLSAEAQNVAITLSIILGEADMVLDRAHDELSAGLFSPFWEAIEQATTKLAAFEEKLTIIEARKAAYRSEAARLDTNPPAFSLGLSVLPDPTSTQRDLTTLYRKAQANPHFAMVYEQRRTTATLIAGFSSLGQAIERLGDRTIDAIRSLAGGLDCRLASLQSSLESAAKAAAEQRAAIQAELHHSNTTDAAVQAALRKEAEARSENEGLALRMLNNIQHRRRPIVSDMS